MSAVRMLKLWLLRAFAAIGLLFVVVTATPVDGWIIHVLAGPWNDPQGEVLILLSADNVGGIIGASSYWRTVYAMRAWRQGGFRQIVVSGGAPAAPMRDFLICQGVPASAVEVETASASTRENALFTARLLANRPGRKVLMTSDYHMFRAWRAFRKAGFDALPRPIPDAAKRIGSWQHRWSEFIGLAVECSKIAYYFVRGWI